MCLKTQYLWTELHSSMNVILGKDFTFSPILIGSCRSPATSHTFVFMLFCPQYFLEKKHIRVTPPVMPKVLEIYRCIRFTHHTLNHRKALSCFCSEHLSRLYSSVSVLVKTVG